MPHDYCNIPNSHIRLNETHRNYNSLFGRISQQQNGIDLKLHLFLLTNPPTVTLYDYSTVKLESLASLNFGKTRFNERNIDKILIKALIFVIFCMVALLWKVKVWQFDFDSPNSSKFPLVKVSTRQSFWLYGMLCIIFLCNQMYVTDLLNTVM